MTDRAGDRQLALSQLFTIFNQYVLVVATDIVASCAKRLIAVRPGHNMRCDSYPDDSINS